MTDHSVGHEEALEEVKGVIRDWRNAVNAGDLDRLLRIAAEDLEIMAPGQFKVDLEPFTNEEVIVCGEWAIHRLTYEITLTPKSGGDPITERGDGFHIFRRDSAAGSWRLVKDVSTSVPVLEST